jgi:hypothetical protein
MHELGIACFANAPTALDFAREDGLFPPAPALRALRFPSRYKKVVQSVLEH